MDMKETRRSRGCVCGGNVFTEVSHDRISNPPNGFAGHKVEGQVDMMADRRCCALLVGLWACSATEKPAGHCSALG